MVGEERQEAIGMEQSVASEYPAEVVQALEELPKEKRAVIEALIVSQTSMISRATPEGEIARKISEEHITQMIASRDKAMEIELAENKSKRRFSLATAALICAAVIVIIFALKDNPEVLEKVIIGLGGAIAGALGGYGFKSSKDDD